MGFLSPVMLWGTAAVAIPIALHFFFRSRYRTVPWAAMKFLLTSIEQTSRRLKLQELLLLATRCALLALLALAMARPITSMLRGSGRGDAVDSVFVFDTSYSMGASDGSVSRLERAKTAALDIIERLPPNSTVHLVTCADRAAMIGPPSPGNLDQAQQLVKNLQLTHLGTDLYPGIQEAHEILKRGQASNKELYVFTDLQKSGWEQQSAGIAKEMQEIKDKASVFFVRCGTRERPIKNVAVIGISPQSGVPRPGDRVGFAVLVKNTGAEEVRDLKVSLMVDGDEKNVDTQSIDAIGPGNTRAITMTAKLEKPGLRILTAKISHDDMEGDNRFDHVLEVREQINVLVVDGGMNDREPERSSSFFLMHALVPVRDTERAKYHLQPRMVTPRLASPALLQKTDLCILVNVGLPSEGKVIAKDLPARRDILPGDFVDELGRFVRQGKGLLIYSGDNVQPESYNRLLSKKLGLLPLPIKSVRSEDPKKPLFVNRDTFGLPAFWKFKEDDHYKGFSEIEVLRWLELDESAVPKVEAEEKSKQSPVTVVLRYANGSAAVVSRKVDAGEVLFVGTTADPGWREGSGSPAWTDWPVRLQVYVPFVDVAINHLLHGQAQTHNVTAGEELRWYPTEKELNQYTLVTPDKKPIRLGMPEKMDKRLVVTAGDLTQAGIYRLQARRVSQGDITKEEFDASKGNPIAVIPDLRESQDLESLSDEQLAQVVGFEPVILIAGDESNKLLGPDRLNREWTMWLLLAVLALVVGETLLAWFCGQAW